MPTRKALMGLTVRLTYASGVSLSRGMETTCLAESYQVDGRGQWEQNVRPGTAPGAHPVIWVTG